MSEVVKQEASMVRQKHNSGRWPATFLTAWVAVALILVALPAAAQSALSTIHGTVKDERARRCRASP